MTLGECVGTAFNYRRSTRVNAETPTYATGWPKLGVVSVGHCAGSQSGAMPSQSASIGVTLPVPATLQ